MMKVSDDLEANWAEYDNDAFVNAWDIGNYVADYLMDRIGNEGCGCSATIYKEHDSVQLLWWMLLCWMDGLNYAKFGEWDTDQTCDIKKTPPYGREVLFGTKGEMLCFCRSFLSEGCMNVRGTQATILPDGG